MIQILKLESYFYTKNLPKLNYLIKIENIINKKYIQKTNLLNYNFLKIYNHFLHKILKLIIKSHYLLHDSMLYL